jgi:hypothetical protein
MLKRTTAAHHKHWQLGEADRWDLDGPVLRWTFEDRAAEANVQVIGSYSTGARSWMWGWANQSLPAHLRSSSETVRVSGEAHGHTMLTVPTVEGISEDEAADFCAIGFRLMRATGFYRATGEQVALYLAFGPVNLLWDDGRTDRFAIEVD